MLTDMVKYGVVCGLVLVMAGCAAERPRTGNDDPQAFADGGIPPSVAPGETVAPRPVARDSSVSAQDARPDMSLGQ